MEATVKEPLTTQLGRWNLLVLVLGLKNWHAEGGLTERRTSPTPVTLHLHSGGVSFLSYSPAGAKWQLSLGFAAPPAGGALRRSHAGVATGRARSKAARCRRPHFLVAAARVAARPEGPVLAAPFPPPGSARGCANRAGARRSRPSLGDHLGPSAAGAGAATSSRV